MFERQSGATLELPACAVGVQPLGSSLPPGEPHAVSFSLPTWASVAANMAGEAWVKSAKQATYPRMGMSPCVAKLCAVAMKRLGSPHGMKCRAFVSNSAAIRLDQTLKKKDPNSRMYAVDFHLAQSPCLESLKWGRFVLCLFAEDMESEAFTSWLNHGDGISNRHAEFCLSNFQFMESECKTAGSRYQTPAPLSEKSAMYLPSWTDSGLKEKAVIKSALAVTMKSQQPSLAPVRGDDVFLYATGMLAIGTIARAISESLPKEAVAVIYGWLYSGTGPLVKECGFARYILYGHGTEEELDQLETSLEAGAKVTVLFCEITSNPQLYTPNLVRIKQLADRYDFIVVIDNTIGTSINVDVLPYADVITTSLTKIFSGACNVMGGCLIVNPNSKHYQMIYTGLQDSFEDNFFPLDAKVLSKNCADYRERVRKCSETAREIAHLLAAHPFVEYVNYPTLVSSKAEYENYRREGEGYGYLLSIVFRNPESAVRFYDELDLWKGPSIGMNWTIGLPYSVLAHWEEQDWAATYGVPKHIVRLSIGLEPLDVLTVRVRSALSNLSS
ncbi:hypothetical protein VTL71DRAFT_3531 [Oculimacula yallundae]|uniref:Cystathionine gamma-synthase n=1 Tax=Oculimacula yallundae TaxID=86028 RepID=A0ABR4C7E3_9HELO